MARFNSRVFVNLFLLLCINYILSHSALANQNVNKLDKHQIKLQTTIITQHHKSEDTWLAGDLGRYDLSSNHALAELHLGYTYKFNQNLQFNTHIQAQDSSESLSSSSLGLVEWNVKFNKNIDWQHSFSLTVGQFFLPISIENSEDFWESPYSIHFSALNTWIGEEFRPIGLDAQYNYFTESNDRFSIAATIFGGNDSMGSLLAYRGWSIGRHRTSLGDVLSLPNLDYLKDSGNFSKQRDDGTRPFGKELDNRPGFALRTQFSSDDLILSASWIDNQGDRELHRGEYAWDTKFAVIGAAWLINENWELLSEATQGSSIMGAGPGVDIDFYALYIMGSYLYNDNRFSLRAEQFGNDDKDKTDNESHDFGRVLVIAYSWSPENSNFKAGTELIYLNGKRTRSFSSNRVSDNESYSVSLMLSYSL